MESSSFAWCTAGGISAICSTVASPEVDAVRSLGSLANPLPAPTIPPTLDGVVSRHSARSPYTTRHCSMRELLVAYRSEIAIRVFRAATELGLGTVAVYTWGDRFSLHRFKADESYQI